MTFDIDQGSLTTATGTPDPYTSSAAWDVIILQGKTSPGVCEVREFRRRWVWEEKRPRGSQISTLTYTGSWLARGHIDFYLIVGSDLVGNTLDPFGDWDDFIVNFQYDPARRGDPIPVRIYHPSLEMIKVRNVVTEDITNPVRVETGKYKISASFIEWNPGAASTTGTTNVTTTPVNSKVSPPPVGTVGAQQDPEIVAKQAQIAALLKRANEP